MTFRDALTGCCVMDQSGVPVILYTAVRLRNNHKNNDLPSAEYDLGLPFVEVQCAAIVDPSKYFPNTNIAFFTDDEMLENWKKHPIPILHRPPPNLNLTGWRDPFIFKYGILRAIH